MKINFKNPQTGKPSTVVLADHWVKVYLKVMESSWQDHDQPDHKRTAITHMVTWCSERYFDPCTEHKKPLTQFEAKPSECTFTGYLERYMASMIYHRCQPCTDALDASKAAHHDPDQGDLLEAAEEKPTSDK